MIKILATSLIVSVALSASINDVKCDKILSDTQISICYNYSVKGPNYVKYKVFPKTVDLKNIKKRPRFYRDKRIPKKFAVTSGDYIHCTDSKTKSFKFDRSHLAPDADFDFSKQALLKIYTMANIVPMTSKTNQGLWVAIEDRERAIARLYPITVITGALYEDKNNFLIKKNFEDTLKEGKTYSKKKLSKKRRQFEKYTKSLLRKKITIPTKLYKILEFKDKKECYIVDNFKSSLISKSCQYLDKLLKKN